MDTDVLEQVVGVTEPEPKRGPGRPPTITLEVIDRIARMIAKGLTEEQACIRVGVNHSSFRTARHRSPEFETAIKSAQAEYLDSALDTIGKGKPGWQGLAWILERRHGWQFRRTSEVDLNASVSPKEAIERLMRKPLECWTRADAERSMGVWQILKSWSAARLSQLVDVYERVWPLQDCSFEFAEWRVEVLTRILQLDPPPESSGPEHDRLIKAQKEAAELGWIPAVLAISTTSDCVPDSIGASVATGAIDE
jgi:hypothetical protein